MFLTRTRLVVLAVVLGSFTGVSSVYARPKAPPRPDIAPAPIPPEGQKKTVPHAYPKRVKKVPGTNIPPERPPVKPPTPEPMAPDSTPPTEAN